MGDLPDDVWERVFDVDPGSTRRGLLLSTLHHRLALGVIRARNVLPTRLQRVVEEGADLLQGEVCSLVLLPPETVRCEPYETRRRVGGGEYHLFSASSVRSLFLSNGGANRYTARLTQQRERVLKKRKADETLHERKRHAAATRKRSLDNALKRADLGGSLEIVTAVVSERLSEPLFQFDDAQLRVYLDDSVLKPVVSLGDVVTRVKYLVNDFYTDDNIAKRARLRAENAQRLEAAKLAREADAKARAEAAAAIRADSELVRRCTHEGCKNLVRIYKPAIRASGPVCGACERFAD